VQSPAGELQPSSVQERTQLVHARNPDHHGRRVGYRPETLLAFTELSGSLQDAGLEVKPQSAQFQMRPHAREKFLPLKRLADKIDCP
jgi:hypothetical protein